LPLAGSNPNFRVQYQDGGNSTLADGLAQEKITNYWHLNLAPNSGGDHA
jgi:hypothetical protein